VRETPSFTTSVAQRMTAGAALLHKLSTAALDGAHPTPHPTRARWLDATLRRGGGGGCRARERRRAKSAHRRDAPMHRMYEHTGHRPTPYEHASDPGRESAAAVAHARARHGRKGEGRSVDRALHLAPTAHCHFWIQSKPLTVSRTAIMALRSQALAHCSRSRVAHVGRHVGHSSTSVAAARWQHDRWARMVAASGAAEGAHARALACTA
jgi:hypothetical protein